MYYPFTNFSKYSYQELSNMIKEEFGTDIPISDIRLYFEPNTQEEIEDLMLQLKNLNL